ncbi:helix-turn-helix domain-containing protein [Sciscionella marina]|uniref:helix-turn-helix domain-containing protein n=1 Tax=Sciscionella marina TaxID=508770 RepID=UPI0003815250|nr:helix-turn-helix domain-containing protein [Sciscionella marina]
MGAMSGSMCLGAGRGRFATGEIQAHLAEIYGAQVSRETISKITDLDDETRSRPGSSLDY